MRFQIKEDAKFWDKVSCTLGKHNFRKPYYWGVFPRGKICYVPKFIGIQLVTECKFCYYSEYTLTTKSAKYDEWEKVVRELNRTPSKLERALK